MSAWRSSFCPWSSPFFHVTLVLQWSINKSIVRYYTDLQQLIHLQWTLEDHNVQHFLISLWESVIPFGSLSFVVAILSSNLSVWISLSFVSLIFHSFRRWVSNFVSDSKYERRRLIKHTREIQHGLRNRYLV